MRKHLHGLILGTGLIALLFSAAPAEAKPPKTVPRSKALTPEEKAAVKAAEDAATDEMAKARVPPRPYVAPRTEVTDRIRTFGLIKSYGDDMILVGHPVSNSHPEHLKALGVLVAQTEQEIAPNKIYKDRLYRAYQVATDGPPAAMIERR